MYRHRQALLLLALALMAATVLMFTLGARPGSAVLRVADTTWSAPAVDPSAGASSAERRELAGSAVDQMSPGTLLTFHFEANSSVVLGEQAVTTRLAGAMTLLVVDRRGDELLAEVRFPGARVSIDGGSDAAAVAFCSDLAQALGEATSERLDMCGRTLGYRFGKLISDHRNWVRTLVSAFRFVIADEAASTWEVLEADATGMARIVYQRTDAGTDQLRLIRTKTCYPELANARPSGRAVARCQRGSLWPLAAEIDDQLLLDLPEAAAQAQSRFTARLELLSVERATDLPAADWSAPWAPASGSDERSELAAEVMARQWRQRLAGVRLEDVLQQLAGIVAQQPVRQEDLLEALELLAKLVELRPETVAALAQLLRDPAADPQVAALALNALARAGTAAAQDLLAGCAQDPVLPAALRTASLEAMFGLHAPAPEIVARIGRVLTDATAITPVEAAAMLLLGALADRSSEGPAILLAAEARAQREHLLPLWLESLGNAGTTGVVAAAQRYTDADDETVRSAAMTALRKVATAGAVAVLADKVVTDASPAVRLRAAAALAETPAPVDIRLLLSVAGSDPDASVRGAALQGLGRRGRDQSLVRAFLQRRAIEEPCADLRALCVQLLGE